MTFQDLILRNNWEAVELAFIDLFPDLKDFLHAFESVFVKLSTMRKTKSDIIIELIDREFEGNSGKHNKQACGKLIHHDVFPERPRLHFVPWAECLAMKIDEECLKKYSEPVIIAYCMFEITYYGFDEKTIWNWNNQALEASYSIDKVLRGEFDDEKLKELPIKEAEEYMNETLTQIAIESKSFWGYSEKEMKIFLKELRITKKYIYENPVFIYEQDNVIKGFFSIKHRKKSERVGKALFERGYWIDHMFVLPKYMCMGIGEFFIFQIVMMCESKYIKKIRVLADPHSKEFYEKMGFEYVKDIPSSIEGRSIPMLVYTVEC